LGKERLIVEVSTAKEAKNVEETVKTGYLDATIDTLTNWMGVEDDLADSYEGLADKAQTPAAKAAYRRLCDESKKSIEQLTEIQKSLEGLDKAQVQRLKLLAGLES
jgi:hypothetical protein